MNKLKPCPFCDGKTSIENDEYYSGILCGQCGYGWSFEDCEPSECKDAITAWNTRPIEDSLRARAEVAEARVAQLERAIAENDIPAIHNLRALVKKKEHHEK